jgi:hypothetical protein
MTEYFLCDYCNCGAIFSNDFELTQHKVIHNYLEMTEKYRKLLIQKLETNSIFKNHNKSDKKTEINSENNKNPENSFDNKQNEEKLKEEKINKILKSLLIENSVRIECDFPKCGFIFDKLLDLNSHKIIHLNLNSLDPKVLVKIERQENERQDNERQENQRQDDKRQENQRQDDKRQDNQRQNNDVLYCCVWPNCWYNTYEQTTILSHLRTHFSNHPFKCEFHNCFERFMKRNLWRTHQFSHYYKIIKQINNDFKYVCLWNQCSFNTNDILLINQHIESHLNEMSFKCNQINCEQSFSSESLLNIHYLTFHNNYISNSVKNIDLSYFFSKRIVNNSEFYVCDWPQCGFSLNFDFVAMTSHIQQHYKT